MAIGRDSKPGRARWRTLGVLLVLTGAAALWMALTSDWDLSEDWEAGVGTEWMPTSFEFIGLMAVVAAAGASMGLGILFLIGKLPRPTRHSAIHPKSHSNSSPETPDDGAQSGERRCRCCGTTSGLVHAEDICFECDVAYYS